MTEYIVFDISGLFTVESKDNVMNMLGSFIEFVHYVVPAVGLLFVILIGWRMSKSYKEGKVECAKIHEDFKHELKIVMDKIKNDRLDNLTILEMLFALSHKYDPLVIAFNLTLDGQQSECPVLQAQGHEGVLIEMFDIDGTLGSKQLKNLRKLGAEKVANRAPGVHEGVYGISLDVLEPKECALLALEMLAMCGYPDDTPYKIECYSCA